VETTMFDFLLLFEYFWIVFRTRFENVYLRENRKNFYSGLTDLLLFLLFKAYSKQTIILLLAIIRQKKEILQVTDIYISYDKLI